MKRAITTAILILAVSGLVLVLAGRRNVSVGATPAIPQIAQQTEVPQLVQDNGQEYLVLKVDDVPGLTVSPVREIALPGVLETTGQVTFDDRMVSTIISRVNGRLEDIRVSQWDTVRKGENILSLYSPDFMTAEAEYLEAKSAAQASSTAGKNDNYGLSNEVSHLSADLQTAAVRKLELLGLSKDDVANITEATPSRWMRAPISGIVVTKLALRGAQVSPGDQLFALATLQRVWIMADIYEVDYARVRVGENLEAVTVSYPDEVFKGVVDRISPSVDPNAHVLSLRCEIQNPGERLKPQMLARVRIVTRPGAALVVPQQALVFDGDSYNAFVKVGPDRIERRKVEVASWNEHGYARILSGLKAGEEVVVKQAIQVNALWHAAHGQSS
jgi:membrane fusion protein, copper/silver efflux system